MSFNPAVPRPPSETERRQATVTPVDRVWNDLREAATRMVDHEPMLASMAHNTILSHERFEDALAYRLAHKLGGGDITDLTLRTLINKALSDEPSIGVSARADMVAILDRDPAIRSHVQPMLFYKGFAALQGSRVAHHYWTQGRKDLANALQVRISEVFAVDIHPGAQIGKGIMIDHGTGVVIGETAIVEDDVSMLHGVTLGGTGKEAGDRHPKIGFGVLIGANASILGNIRIGYCSRIGAGSVVLEDVPPCKTVVGVPGKIVGNAGCSHPSHSMDHRVDSFSGEG